VCVFQVRRSIAQAEGDTLGLAHAYTNIAAVHLQLGRAEKAIEFYEQGRALALEVGDLALEGAVCGNLGVSYMSMNRYEEAVELLRRVLSIFQEVGDEMGEGAAYNNLGMALHKSGDAVAAAHLWANGLLVLQEVERKVGPHDDRRLSVVQEQQSTYRQLQEVLIELEHADWALGVCCQAKSRALTQFLAETQTVETCQASAVDISKHSDNVSTGSDTTTKTTQRCASQYVQQNMWEAEWNKVQNMARMEGASAGHSMAIIEYFFLSDDTLGVWVVSGTTGLLLANITVPTTGFSALVDTPTHTPANSRTMTLHELIAKTRNSMKVRGRDIPAEAAATLVVTPVYGGVEEEVGEEEVDRAVRGKWKEDPEKDLRREKEFLTLLCAVLIGPVAGAIEEVLSTCQYHTDTYKYTYIYIYIYIYIYVYLYIYIYIYINIDSYHVMSRQYDSYVRHDSVNALRNVNDSYVRHDSVNESRDVNDSCVRHDSVNKSCDVICET